MIPPECGKEHLPSNLIGNQQFSGTWGRLKWDAVSPTIDTRFDASSNGTNNHPFCIEQLHQEKLQESSHSMINLYLLDPSYILGSKLNAVPPLMAKAIADQIDIILRK